MTILVTGCLGFIGSHLVKQLFKKNEKVIGIDNLSYYSGVEEKKNRLKEFKNKNFIFYKCDISDKNKLIKIFKKNKIDLVVNLAAQVGARHSLTNPDCYISSNINGFYNILECCKFFNVQRLIYASSSSVYGNKNKVPFKENYSTDEPESLYGATKKCNEILAEFYSSSYKIQCTGLRFFTVYGPDGRPDMAPMLFAKKIIENSAIEIFNKGHLSRDFTYIEDIVSAILLIIYKKLKYKHNIYNVGCSNPVVLKDFLYEISKNLNKKPIIINKKMQKGDVYKTHANIDKIKKDYGYSPKFFLKDGIKIFIDWFKKTYE